jgi:hypothetical protein
MATNMGQEHVSFSNFAVTKEHGQLSVPQALHTVILGHQNGTIYRTHKKWQLRCAHSELHTVVARHGHM